MKKRAILTYVNPKRKLRTIMLVKLVSKSTLGEAIELVKHLPAVIVKKVTPSEEILIRELFKNTGSNVSFE